VNVGNGRRVYGSSSLHVAGAVSVTLQTTQATCALCKALGERVQAALQPLRRLADRTGQRLGIKARLQQRLRGGT
jgi:hypothetical protein